MPTRPGVTLTSTLGRVLFGLKPGITGLSESVVQAPVVYVSLGTTTVFSQPEFSCIILGGWPAKRQVPAASRLIDCEAVDAVDSRQMWRVWYAATPDLCAMLMIVVCGSRWLKSV